MLLRNIPILICIIALFLIVPKTAFSANYVSCDQIKNRTVEIYKNIAEDLITGVKAGQISVNRLIEEALKTRRYPRLREMETEFKKLSCSIEGLTSELNEKYKEIIENLRFNQNDLNNLRIR